MCTTELLHTSVRTRKDTNTWVAHTNAYERTTPRAHAHRQHSRIRATPSSQVKKKNKKPNGECAPMNNSIHTDHANLCVWNRIVQSSPTYLNWHPFLVGQCWPDVMGFCNCGLVRFKDDLCTVSVDVQGAKNEDQTRKCCVRRNSLQPIVVQVKQHHLRLCGFQNHVTKLLNLENTTAIKHGASQYCFMVC